MVKLLQFLYRSFDFDDLWLSYDDYRAKTIESQGLDLVTTTSPHTPLSLDCNNNPQPTNISNINNLSLNPQIINNNNNIIQIIESQQFDDKMKSKYLKSYLMTKCQFGRLLKMKCKLFLKTFKQKNNIKQPKRGIFICCAIELLLEYPLNDKYGLLKPTIYGKQHPLNKYHNKKYIDNFDKNANQDIDSLNNNQQQQQQHNNNNNNNNGDESASISIEHQQSDNMLSIQNGSNNGHHPHHNGPPQLPPFITNNMIHHNDNHDFKDDEESDLLYNNNNNNNNHSHSNNNNNNHNNHHKKKNNKNNNKKNNKKNGKNKNKQKGGKNKGKNNNHKNKKNKNNHNNNNNNHNNKNQQNQNTTHHLEESDLIESTTYNLSEQQSNFSEYNDDNGNNIKDVVFNDGLIRNQSDISINSTISSISTKSIINQQKFNKKNKSKHKKAYSGPNWQYEFERLLTNKNEWNLNENNNNNNNNNKVKNKKINNNNNINTDLLNIKSLTTSSTTTTTTDNKASNNNNNKKKYGKNKNNNNKVKNGHHNNQKHKKKQKN